MSSQTLIELKGGATAKVSTDTFHRRKLGRYEWRVIRMKGGRAYAYRAGRGNKMILMHRWILQAPKGVQVDHRNADGLDNTDENIRLCTAGQNSANRPKDKDNVSGFKGVTWAKSPRAWMAVIVVAGVRHYLGTYPTAERAARAHDRAACYFHGEFAGLNFPVDRERTVSSTTSCAPNCVTHGPKPTDEERKAKRRHMQKLWMDAHPERHREAMRRSYLKHRTKRLEYAKRYQAARKAAR